jgi:hypothetical protein
MVGYLRLLYSSGDQAAKVTKQPRFGSRANADTLPEQKVQTL